MACQYMRLPIRFDSLQAEVRLHAHIGRDGDGGRRLRRRTPQAFDAFAPWMVCRHPPLHHSTSPCQWVPCTHTLPASALGDRQRWLYPPDALPRRAHRLGSVRVAGECPGAVPPVGFWVGLRLHAAGQDQQSEWLLGALLRGAFGQGCSRGCKRIGCEKEPIVGFVCAAVQTCRKPCSLAFPLTASPPPPRRPLLRCRRP